MNKFCANCGNPLDQDAVFCENCGTRVVDKTSPNERIQPAQQSAPQQQPLPPQQHVPRKSGSGTKKVLIIVFSILGVFILITIAGVLLLLSKKDEITKKVQDSVTEKITDELGIEGDFDSEDWGAAENIIEDITDQIETEYDMDIDQFVQDQLIEDNSNPIDVPEDEEYYGGDDGLWDASILPVEVIEGQWQGYLEEYSGDEMTYESYIEFDVYTENGQVTSIGITEELEGEEGEYVAIPAWYTDGILTFETSDGLYMMDIWFFEDESGAYGYGYSNEYDGYVMDITLWRP
jgi:hypothetical protein